MAQHRLGKVQHTFKVAEHCRTSFINAFFGVENKYTMILHVPAMVNRTMPTVVVAGYQNRRVKKLKIKIKRPSERDSD